MGTAIERVPPQAGMEGGSRVAQTIFNRKVLAGALVVALIAGALYWFLAGSEALAAMTVRLDRGAVEVIRDGEAVAVDGNLELSPGDVVRTGADSVASLRLEGARRLQLLGSTEIKIVSGSSFDSLRGRVLSDSSARLEAGIGDVSITTSSSQFRIDNLMGSARAGVFEGSVSVDAPGSAAMTVPELFQTSISGGRVFGREPYALDEGDFWDARILKGLVAFEDELSSVKDGFALQIGGSRPDLAYFGSLTDKSVSFMKPYLDPKRLKDGSYTADLMVGFMVATHAPGSPSKAFKDAYELFFERDATWGIVAGIVLKGNDERLGRLVSDLEDAFLGTGVVAEASGGEPDFASPAEASDDAAAAGGGDTGSSGYSGSSGTAPPTGGDSSTRDDGGGDTPTGGGTNDETGGGGTDDGDGDGGTDGDGDDGGGGDCIECAVEDLLPPPSPPSVGGAGGGGDGDGGDGGKLGGDPLD